MVHYLIEFRFHGKAKSEIKKLVHEINRNFGLRTKRPIPHITLAGPFYTRDEKRLIGDFNRLCSGSPLMNFEIEGFSAFEDSKVVFLDVKPGSELEEFRWHLAELLKPYCQLRPFDYQRDFSFHATIAMKLPEEKFSRIKEYIKKKNKLNFKHFMVRATLIKGQIILREYDFLLRRPLIRRLAKDKQIYPRTRDLLKAYFEGRYDPNEYMGETIKLPDRDIFDKVKGLFKKPRTFITSDLHLDHTNIIQFCKRPFLNTEEMNKTLVENWNNTIGKQDTVYFLGDLAFGRGSRPTKYWLKKLNGNIIFIKGGHDDKRPDRFFTTYYKQEPTVYSRKITLRKNYILEYKGYKFFLTHEPEDVPGDWHGWAICGHHHNNNLEEHPFIDKKNKRVNISTELTKFRPVNMDDLIKKIGD